MAKKNKKRNKGTEVAELIEDTVIVEGIITPESIAHSIPVDFALPEGAETLSHEAQTEPEPVRMAPEEAGADPQKITDRSEIIEALDAVIFASPKALSFVRLRNILNAHRYDTSELADVLEEMIETYSRRGFNLVKVGGGFQFRSAPKHADILQKLLEDKPARLSASALEVLAIIAYKQPLSRSEIDAIRGVDSGHLLKGLLEKNLVRTTGHAETAGRPLLYGTSSYFLEVFSLGSLDDLAAIDEFKRELVEGESAGSEALDGDLLAADPSFFDKASPLAANPDRGSFDEPSEDKAELPDFGLAERAAESS